MAVGAVNLDQAGASSVLGRLVEAGPRGIVEAGADRAREGLVRRGAEVEAAASRAAENVRAAGALFGVGGRLDAAA